jgi:hypothetical protein
MLLENALDGDRGAVYSRGFRLPVDAVGDVDMEGTEVA